MRNIHSLSILAAAATLVAGCQSTSPYWDARFGQATRQATAMQIIAPEASQAEKPPSGLDGQAARGAIHEYSKSFVESAQQESVLTIEVGNSQK